MNVGIEDWQRSFSIADQSICLAGNSQKYLAEIEKFIRLYAVATPNHAGIAFDFLSNGDEQYLLLDGQEELWHCRNGQEMVAAFEIQLYTQVIQRIYPKFLSIHAGSVACDGEAWMFAGESGAGKSSVTTAGLLSGCRYMTDEFSLLDEQGEIHPMPRPMQWDEPEHPAFPHTMMLEGGCFEREFFIFPDYQGVRTRLQLWLPKQVEQRALPLTKLFFPHFDASADVAQMTPMRRSDALMTLSQHIHQQMLPSERIKALNKRLPKDVRCYDLLFSDVHAAWKMLSQHDSSTLTSI